MSHGVLVENIVAQIEKSKGSQANTADLLLSLRDDSGADFQSTLVTAFKGGYFPEFIRHLQPVEVSGKIRGSNVRLRLWVTPDYLSIGSDGDFVRVPLSLDAAMAIASFFDATLPTKKIVDAIYDAAVIKLEPKVMGASILMSSTDYMIKHDRLIDEQMASSVAVNGLLVSGHKKDLVHTNQLKYAPRKMAIYGWHRGVKKPIQPLSVVHRQSYVDYSHGVRLVSRNVDISFDGEPFTPARIESIFVDPDLSTLLSDEGPIDTLRSIVYSGIVSENP
jgi:hypothetical protein